MERQNITNNSLVNLKKDVAFGVVLTFLTCGIYNLFWQHHQIKTINILLEEERLSWGRWFLLTIVTCGLYHIYHEYLMAKYILEIQQAHQLASANASLPTIAIILSIVGLPFITDAIEQKELNEIIDKLA